MADGARLRRPQGGGGRRRDRRARAGARALRRAARPTRRRSRRCSPRAPSRRARSPRHARRRARRDGRRPGRRLAAGRRAAAARPAHRRGRPRRHAALRGAGAVPAGARATSSGLEGGPGVLVASYPVGTLLGALPGGWLAARSGAAPRRARRARADDGLGVAFALARSIVVLDLARFLQGLGGAATWTAGLAWLARRRAARAPRRGARLCDRRGDLRRAVRPGGRRGRRRVGRGPTFAVGRCSRHRRSAPGRWSLPPPRGRGGPRRAAAALRDRTFLAAAVADVPALAGFRRAEVLVPLRLDGLGASALAIGAAFLVAAPSRRSWPARRARRRPPRSAPIVRGATFLAAVALVALLCPTRRRRWRSCSSSPRALLGALWTPAAAASPRRRAARRRPGLGVRAQQPRLGRRRRDRRGGRRRPGAARRRLPAVPRCSARGLRRGRWRSPAGRALG